MPLGKGDFVEGEDREAVLARAKDSYEDDDLVIDGDAKVTDNDVDGHWVQVWVYIPYEE